MPIALFLRFFAVVFLFSSLKGVLYASEQDNTLEQLTELITADFAGERRFSKLHIERIRQIKTLYDQTQIIGVSGSRLDFVDIKFLYSHWYQLKCQLATDLLNDPTSNTEIITRAITTLDILHPYIAADDLKHGLAYSHPSEGLLKLQRIAQENNLPKSTKNLRAYDGNRKYSVLPPEWPEDMQNFPYDFLEDGSVTYRGINFRSGDLFAADLSLPHDGALESFSHEPPLYSHSGTFVNYQAEIGGPRYPSVIEIHKKGKRIVPLAVWLSPQFIYLTRVMRIPEITSDISLELSERYRNLPEISYDWRGRNPQTGGGFSEDRQCATCTSLGANLLSQLGITYPMPHVTFLDSAVDNLAELGMDDVRGFYSPSLLSIASSLRSIGTIDNGLFRDNLSRYLIVGYPGIADSVGYYMGTRRLNTSKLPLRYRITVAEIQIALQKNVIGTIAQTIGGFKKHQMPDSTSAEIMAFYLTSNDAIGIAANSMAQHCQEIFQISRHRTPLRFSDHMASGIMQKRIAEHQAKGGLPGWFD